MNFSFPFPSRASGSDSDKHSSWGKKWTSRTGTALPSNSGTTTPSHSASQASLAADDLQFAPTDAWKGEMADLTPPLAAHIFERSSSSPAPSLAGPSRAPKAIKHSSLQPTSTHSLRLDSRVVSASDDGYFGAAGSKPLSPIVEQDYFSPERRSMPLPLNQSAEMVSTPNGSELSSTYRASPVYSTFLARPLKRSISQMSQMSSRTHASTVSAPPSIPPLDLQPAFFGPLESPSSGTAPRLSPAPVLAAAGDTPHAYSGGYDDGSSLHADSFISAESATPSPPHITETGQPHVNHPYSQAEQGNIRPHVSRSTHSGSSSYVGRRWTTSLSFGSDLLRFTKSRESQETPKRPTPACLLFWVGFVAPWCWMIGGWMLTKSGETKTGEGKGGKLRPLILPLWNSKKKNSEKGVDKGEAKEVVQGYGFGNGYPFVAPSVETLTPSAKQLQLKWTSQEKPRSLDPWVKRCRVAAVVSGILLLVAFVAVCVVIGRQ